MVGIYLGLKYATLTGWVHEIGGARDKLRVSRKDTTLRSGVSLTKVVISIDHTKRSCRVEKRRRSNNIMVWGEKVGVRKSGSDCISTKR
jgi:hypothetical protein